MGNSVESIKSKFERHEPLTDALHAVCQSRQAMFNEVQKDWKQTCKWVKEHPREDAAIAGGALIIGGIALSLKDERDGAKAIVEGNKILQGEQVAAEKVVLCQAGADRFLTTSIKFGNNTEEQFWVDSNSVQGRRLIEQNSGLGGAFKK